MTPRRHALDRRSFLKGAGAASALLATLATRVGEGAIGRPARRASAGNGAYGPIAPARDAAEDGVVRLALPAGFSYVTIGIGGSIMSDGNPTPNAHDGMAAFATAEGRVRLIRNHEQVDVPPAATCFGDPATAYDRRGPGGCTTLEIEVTAAGERRLVRDFVSLNGTLRNCAGGLTPWGSWLTCEEATDGLRRGFTKPHGYVFEVPALANDEVAAVPYPTMGRFTHEAVAVDPATGIVYETEDREPGGLYRYVPEHHGDLRAGRLQMLAIKGQPAFDTRTGQHVARALPATWVDIAEPDPANAETVSGAVYTQGLAAGGARFAHPEGCWWGRQSLFFTCTSGGDARLGQVWEYRASGLAGGHLLLVFESPSRDLLANPDNIVVSPNGGLLVCEDSDRATQYLRGLTRDGRVFDFAANLLNRNEFAGACFSPDGRTLFVNIQGSTRVSARPVPGYTFAIWGPFEDGAL